MAFIAVKVAASFPTLCWNLLSVGTRCLFSLSFLSGPGRSSVRICFRVSVIHRRLLGDFVNNQLVFNRILFQKHKRCQERRHLTLAFESVLTTNVSMTLFGFERVNFVIGKATKFETSRPLLLLSEKGLAQSTPHHWG